MSPDVIALAIGLPIALVLFVTHRFTLRAAHRHAHMRGVRDGLATARQLALHATPIDLTRDPDDDRWWLWDCKAHDCPAAGWAGAKRWAATDALEHARANHTDGNTTLLALTTTPGPIP